jgi:hypothetical protein
MPILDEVWKLRTDPFYPAVDAGGRSIPPEAIEQSLDPRVDERVVQYYFDVYDWTASHLIRELSRTDALRVFPTPRDLPRKSALMVLISGEMQTGQDSLANLLLHKIRRMGGQLPLVVDVELDGRDKARNVARVARRIITVFDLDREPLDDAQRVEKERAVEKMEKEWERTRKEEEGRSDATYADLFATLRDLLVPFKRQVVIRVIAGGDHDSWMRIYESAKSLCTYLLVMTSDPAFVKTCYDAMITQSRNVVWIRAVRLDRSRAEQYLMERLAAERLPGADLDANEALLPFTSSGIDALYEPGPVPSREPLAYAIGWLRQTFSRALAERHAELTRLHDNAPLPMLENLDPNTTRIEPARLRAAREILNCGK